MVAHLRRTLSDGARWFAAIFAPLGLVLFGLPAKIQISEISVAWFGVIFLLGQVLLALPRIRVDVHMET